MARNYAGLGAIYIQREDVAGAREAWTKALALFEQVGMKPEIEKMRGLLASLPRETPKP
jgi:Flp pilus assembly protein TadD